MKQTKVWFVLSLVLSALLSPEVSRADLCSQAVPYEHDGTRLVGYLAYDDAVKDPRPAVLVVHEWWGLNDYTKKRTRQLAELGYVAFAADIYGEGLVAKDRTEAGSMAGKFRGGDRALLRGRVNAGLQALLSNPLVDKRHVAAIGYCFGGTTVLELARSGADIAGVVSFHGGLDTPKPATAGNLKAKVLVLHGADDPSVPPAQVSAFQEEMRSAGADWQLVMYGGAVHSFTNPDSGSEPSRGAAYDEKADRRSWEHMKVFFAEILGSR
ncbi:MAG TPA: dienelactone hydrolase family protein [Deltaproteobacteria bacterium]|jgi:dienelactone hydrolase|nr:dienelactone hydrolase family protein [Deltaproteobacteria bacterium]NMD39408.1 dienelactone hydrolase family protein [Deltaproteobacteria bacterium]HNQ85604.1 dienelactone hydrolase family protein [Deltaproteobacteria bacterium]HNS89820.1 dienelactone hydrolase family protein [Deltaproteobacteria bacterium]HOA44404.1 dienelactone hydrolase family protein [Deltaproteobacteria bacterium]